MANLTFVANTVSSTGTIPLDQIPQEVKDDAEEVYKVLKTNHGRMKVDFPSVGELNAYIANLKAYCEQRPEGAIRFRKSPTRNLPKTSMEFRITDLETPEEATTNGIRQAVEEVKTTTKK